MALNFSKSHLKLIAVFLPIGAGIGLLLYDCFEYQEGVASNKWIPASGKMLSNSIKAERPLLRRMIFIPTVSYSYHVTEDEVLRGDRMSFPDHVPAPEKDLKKLLERVEVGHQVTSFYDPNNKSHVTLFRGVRRAKYVLLFCRDAAIAALGIIFGLSMLFRRSKAVVEDGPDTI